MVRIAVQQKMEVLSFRLSESYEAVVWILDGEDGELSRAQPWTDSEVSGRTTVLVGDLEPGYLQW